MPLTETAVPSYCQLFNATTELSVTADEVNKMTYTFGRDTTLGIIFL